MNINEFRNRLQEITDNYIGDDAGRQIQLILDLSLEYPHPIRLKQEAIATEPATFKFNCYDYAFDLVESPEVSSIARRHANIFPNSEYVMYLIREELLNEVDSEKVQEATIIYFQGSEPRHAGKLDRGRINSKWGLCHLWEHAVYEVPSSYGNSVKFFSKINRSEAIDAFLKYAKSRGI